MGKLYVVLYVLKSLRISHTGRPCGSITSTTVTENVKLLLGLIKYHTMRMYVGVEILLRGF